MRGGLLWHIGAAVLAYPSDLGPVVSPLMIAVIVWDRGPSAIGAIRADRRSSVPALTRPVSIGSVNSEDIDATVGACLYFNAAATSRGVHVEPE